MRGLERLRPEREVVSFPRRRKDFWWNFLENPVVDPSQKEA
jgi:hypothetical protein